ncbi:MAG: PDZ domain-containing protein [Victivallales bacterium]|jgi:S1-C subfamily serine protease
MHGGNPADKAGIEPGDVIVAVDSQPVNQPKEGIVISRVHDNGSAASTGLEDTRRWKINQGSHDKRYMFST